ncbi:hypothetical protein [Flavobacterium ustbae]|uniref:hypothetical protein n=1 Tax=Flavobacterium ustbae TaxID=2488790 RepID=UPI000F774B2F|nr:hypothetical protein [Flavobacterium ustbae]
MISQIGIEEFREKLKINTKSGNPKISGTPFHVFNIAGEKDKLFFGTINQNDFKITRNATIHPIPFILNGKIKSLNKNQTEIFYEIIPIKFGYYWIRYLPIAAFFLFNIIFIIENAPSVVFIIFNLFIAVTGTIVNLLMNYKKKKFEEKFIEVFKIID